MTGDIVTERAALFLGSRLKRLAERMQSDVIHVAERAGLSVQPGQYPLLATLDRYGPQTVGELAQAMAISQPTVTRTVARLAEDGLVGVDRRGRDQRHKTVALTPAGEAAVARSKALVWPAIELAVNEITDGLSGTLLEQIAALETRLAERPLHLRARAHPGPRLTVLDYADDLAPGDLDRAFHDINAQWIHGMYRLEAADRDVLENPRARVIDPGGAILFVEAEGLGIVGACALKKTGEGEFELTKMGVLEKARGLKAGEFLLQAVIARAQAMGVKTLYLLSNKKSQAAIHLYEKLGFVHDAGIMSAHGAAYERCDVAMLYKGEAAAEHSQAEPQR